MEHNLSFIAPVAIAMGAFLLVAALRYMRHLERMNMIERGLGIDDLTRAERRREHPFGVAYLLIGAAVGLLTAIFTAHLLGGWLSEQEGTGVYFAFIGLGAGLGLIVSGRKKGE